MGKLRSYFIIKTNLFGYSITLFIIVLMLTFAFLTAPINESINGLINIAISNDNLISDYIVIGGLSGAFLNAALVTTLALVAVFIAKADVTGPVIAGLFTVTGFAFFGKDITNVLPIFAGVYLNAVYQKQPYKQHIVAALFGTTMSPAVSAIMLLPNINRLLAILLGISLGLFVGFILPYVAKYAYKIHNGFNLYNIGFSSGLILMVVVSFLRVLGFRVEPVLLWSQGNDFIISIFLGIFYLGLFLLAYLFKNNPYQQIVKFNKEAGVAPTDFYINYGVADTFINMALIGIISHLFVLLFNVPLNGPTVGGILTIVAFGAYGKNVRNVVFILSGAAIGHFIGLWNMTTPSIILGALFGTGIAPIAGKYGFIVGTIAIMLHISLVQNVGALYLGLNLYNNGFAEGFTGFIIPAIVNEVIKEKKEAR
jgi:hypothetical protein